MEQKEKNLPSPVWACTGENLSDTISSSLPSPSTSALFPTWNVASSSFLPLHIQYPHDQGSAGGAHSYLECRFIYYNFTVHSSE
jgi:hypothetical protein